MDFCFMIEIFGALVALFLVLFVIVIYFTSEPHPSLYRHESEKYFLTENGKKSKFPTLYDAPSIQLSVIVPAYNEEERLPSMLIEATDYLENLKKTKKLKYEIIVVDDGSSDKTSEVALQYTKKFGSDTIRVLTFEKNRGKGGAIRLGFLSARGEYLLFADADGATKFSDLYKLQENIETLAKSHNDMAVVCGSRAHLQDESISQRSLFRTFLMYGFHFLVWFLCVRGIKDTQCGFKLLTRSAALLLFSNVHVERWAFDVDMLYLAQYFKIPIGEVPVTWQEIEGSKMIPVFSWLQMGKDLLLIRFRYMIGAWKIKKSVE